MEEELGGGGLTRVVRVGETVRRSAGPWTPSVHALLEHLRGVGFSGAPRVLGVEAEQEVLEFIPGETTDDYDDGALAAAARLVRAYHDAVATFAPPRDAAWQFLVGAPRDGEIVCHNDLAPANTILRRGEPVAFVDWDLAAPGPRLWDVAYAAYRFIPLYDDESYARLGIPARPRAPRLRLFCDAYGLDDSSGLLATIRARVVSLYETARMWGTEGRPGWADVWRDTRGEQWLASVRYLDAYRDAFDAALGG